MRILFCGDIMPGGVLSYQDQFVSNKVLDLLSSVDFRVGTLECAIGDDIPFDERKMSLEGGKNIVYAREEDFERVKQLNINLVTLANNHVFDLGVDGLINTIKLLDEKGIAYCGAGRNISEASKPCLVELDGKIFAFIGCCFKGLPPKTIELATFDKPGVFQTDEKEICQIISQLKQEADYVIILPHWGVEYSYVPPKKCYNLAKQMIDAGADAVIGSHTHIMNPRMTYKEKPVFFSMGNFLFPDFCLQAPRPIDYPKSREIVYSLPIVYNYPKQVSHAVRVVWKKSSRIGVVPILDFSDTNQITNVCSFTVLDRNNVLQLLGIWGRMNETLKMAFVGNKMGALTCQIYVKLKQIYSKFKIFICAVN